jgi:hypothetical protein
VKLSEIEATSAIGRTREGRTITVMDLLNAFAIATGTRIGSSEFDAALSDPAQLHAPEIITEAAHFRLLKVLLTEAVKPEFKLPEGQLKELTVDSYKPGVVRVSALLTSHSDYDAAHLLSEALNELLKNA